MQGDGKFDGVELAVTPVAQEVYARLDWRGTFPFGGSVGNVLIELARTVRFCVTADFQGESANPPKHNTFAGWPAMTSVGAYYELEVICRGEADRVTGYMINISAIDDAVRTKALSTFQRISSEQSSVSPGRVLRDVLDAIAPELRGIVSSIRWRLTPYHSIAMDADRPGRVLMSQQFEFSAAHRLNVPSFTAEKNRTIFGKCNNENGHGHNYRVEPVVAVELEHSGFDILDFERIVNQTIIQRFDHKHLNLDTAEFSALNPSVENIAKVCHDLLREPLAKLGADLQYVSVWETEKTRCTYPAPRGNAII
jgi:6-pyruvoyltetrahydropterin/6-carboxytetrahydropterin synthase